MFQVSQHSQDDQSQHSSNLSKRKTIFFWIVIVFILFSLLELLAYVVITSSIPSRIRVRVGNGDAGLRVKDREGFLSTEPKIIHHADRLQNHRNQLQTPAMIFNSELGWDYPPYIVYEISGNVYSHGSLGERININNYDTTTIATYGDSFTYCAEVGDVDTWQTFLASKIRSNVLNFGVGAFGTDQAFLKYYNHDNVVPKVVILGIYPENINRIVNFYRPFYMYKEANGLTKPRFILEDGKIRLLSNPVAKTEDMVNLLNLQFVRNLGKFDRWYQLDQGLPPISFPYMISLLSYRKQILQQINLLASKLMPNTFKPVFPWNLYDEPEPFAIMTHIVDSFVETAKLRGSVPIIFIMPHKDQILELQDYKASRHDPLLAYMKRKGYRFVDLVQLVVDMEPDRIQLDQWYQGHATREGNRMLADLINQYFEKNPELLQ